MRGLFPGGASLLGNQLDCLAIHTSAFCVLALCTVCVLVSLMDGAMLRVAHRIVLAGQPWYGHDNMRLKQKPSEG